MSFAHLGRSSPRVKVDAKIQMMMMTMTRRRDEEEGAAGSVEEDGDAEDDEALTRGLVKSSGRRRGAGSCATAL